MRRSLQTMATTTRDKLWIAYIGWYNSTDGLAGLTEQHAIVPLVASSRQQAKAHLKEQGWLNGIKAHIDGLIALQNVDGRRIRIDAPLDKQL